VSRTTLIGVSVFALLGLGCLSGSALTLCRGLQRHRELDTHRRDWPVVDGVVYTADKTYTSAKESTYRIGTEWVLADGRRFSKSEPSRSGVETVGRKVKLRYDPANPAHSESVDASVNWLVPLILGVFGGIFSALSIRLLSAERRWRRSQVEADA